MSKKIYSNLFYILIVFMLNSCQWMYKDPVIPAYIEIPAFSVNVQASQGTASHNITDVWVFVNGKKLGAYELPAKFPVVYVGNSKIEIFAGVKLNGTAATRAIYSFIERFTINMELFPDSVHVINPVSKYMDGLNFEIMENFESVGYVFQETERSDTSIIKITDPNHVFEGNASGVVYIDKTRKLFETKSLETFRPKNAGDYVFVELNCKSDVPFFVGIYSNHLTMSKQHPVAVITPSKTWKKLYVNLTPTLIREANAVNYNLFIATQLEENTTSGALYLDNIKLIY